MNNELSIPVKIMSVDGDFLSLEILDVAEVCPQCARGEGCGARPWFRGFFRSSRVSLPRLHHESWQPGDHGLLHIPTAILHRLMLHVYGWPLLAFVSALFLLRHCAESMQLVGAIMATLLAAFLSRRYAERRLRRALRLIVQSHSDIQLCVPKNH